MAPDIKDQLAELGRMSRDRLIERWADLYGRSAPPRIRRELLIPFLAYRIQEKAYGGLSEATRAKLKEFSRELERRADRGSATRLKVGTQFLRSWGSATHVVSVTGAGFDYRGKEYRSLSEIARLITGTRWSGPAFFGLKKSASSRSKKA